MKAFCLFLLCGCLGSYSCWAQQLRGGYILANTPECSEFLYLSNGRFLFCGECDIGPYYGSGTFRTIGNRLLLRFDGWQPLVPTVAIDPNFPADSLSSRLTLRVLDATTDESLLGVTVRSESMPTIGASTDGQGLARLNQPLLPTSKLYISLVGYEAVRIEIPSENNRHFLVKLRAASNHHHIAGNTRYSFLLKHSTGHTLLLQNRGSVYRVATAQQMQYYLAKYKELAK